MQPRRPHGHLAPPRLTTMWPISPAPPRPSHGFPSRMSPPPTPVPQNTPRSDLYGAPAPRWNSASVATWTSLPTATCVPSSLESVGPRAKLHEIDPEALQALTDYAWPGNVRELRHVVEIVCQTDRDTVMLTDLPDEVLATPAPADKAPDRQPTLDEMERRYVAATLRAVHGNQTEAAARLGISRKALWEKRKRYGME